MAYTKTAWVDGQAPAISAANLNKLETQYDEAVAQIPNFYTPAGASSGSKLSYSPETYAYNFNSGNTRRLKTALAGAKSGGSGRIAFLGDSTSAGFPGDPRQSAPMAFRDFSESAGFSIQGTGPVVANPGGSPGAYRDPRYSTTGTWTSQSGNANGILQSDQVGSTITFTSDRPGTVVEIRYLGLGTGFTYQVDSGTPVAVTGGATGDLRSVVVTGLSSSLHSVKVTVDSVPSGGAFYLAWIDVRANQGLLVGNFGVNSTTTADWNNGNFYFPGAVAFDWQPQVAFIDLGINDKGAGFSTADFKANQQILIDKFKGVSDVILVTQNPSDGQDYSAYNRAKYELANENNLPLIDVFDAFGSYAASNPLGLYSDAAHPSKIGYALKGRVLFRATV